MQKIQKLLSSWTRSEPSKYFKMGINIKFVLQYFISIMESEGKISKQEAQQKHAKQNESSNENQSEVEDQESEDSASKDSFIVSDDEVEQSFSDDDYESKKKKKKKKREKKEKKQKKKKRRAKRDSDDQSVFADDLEVVDAAQERGLTRLKKNRDKNYKQNQDDEQYQQEEDYGGMGGQQEDYDGGYEHQYYEDESQQSQYRNRRQEEADLNDLLDERVRKQFFAQTTDKQIVDMNLPERQIMRYKNYAKITDTQIQTVQKDFENEDRYAEAKWIFERLRQMGQFQIHDEKQCRQQIYNVLLAMHQEHLQIMYIYYYRKKIWNMTLNLNLLMKIEEIDEEWITFKKQLKTLKDDITSVIPSFHEVPRSLEDALSACTDIRQLKYFKEYTTFIMAKRKPDSDLKTTNIKLNTIRQICDKGIDVWINDREIFLSPHNFCLNIRTRIQEKKPKTPSIAPDKALRKVLRQKGRDDDDYNRRSQNTMLNQKAEEIEDKEKDWSTHPLLSPDKRIHTLINFLAIELFNYPELRKLLKERYYKRLLISTYPTNKGSHYINIYNSFFPVKRIKEKPVTSLRKQMWILAREAEKLGLITIQLKFQWQLSSSTDKKNFEGDPIYSEMVKYYFDLTSSSSGETWNLLRKQVLIRMLSEHFFPAFMEEIKEDLTREGSREIIQACCQKFRNQLNKGPSLKNGQPIKILAMVLQQQKLGIAVVDQQGKEHSPLSIELRTDDELKKFVSDQILSHLIDQQKPDMILVSANCRRAQTLRKQLRNPSLFSESSIYCSFGQYEVPSLIANKNIIQGISSQKCILEAISMARLKKNPMAQILGLWSENIEQNGVYSMNLHPLQKYIDKRKLIDALEKVAIEMVNLVGIDIQTIRNSDNCRNILQFISGLGPRKAFDLIEKVKERCPSTRKQLLDYVRGSYVYVNCSPFIKFERPQYLDLLEKTKNSRGEDTKKDKNSKKSRDQVLDKSQINLLDMTRIPEEWYALTQRLFLQYVRSTNMLELKHKKSSNNLTDQQIAVREMFKNPQKLKNVEWESRKNENPIYDENLIKAQIMNPFRDPRDPQKVIQNKQIFYSLLKETPQTLRKYMVVTVKVLSVNRQFLNVVIPENGLFGYIRLPNDNRNNSKPVQYEKGQFIKAVITGFSFDQRLQKQKHEGDQEQQLLKVEMSLNFPHRSEDKNHDCQKLCLPSILKQIHPNLDLGKDDRQNFDLSKESMPVVEVKQENLMRPKTEYKRISHPKFKNINMQTAVQDVKMLKDGDFIIRPSTQGSNFLTITWHFFKNVVCHIKLKLEQRTQPGALPTFRILDKAQDKVYASLDELIERYLKPMNFLVQDVTTNKKFLSIPIDMIEQKVRQQTNRQQSYIQYFFGCSPDYPQFFVLVYMFRDKKPTKELIRVKNDGLHFHDQVFGTLRELISFFKEHLKDKRYQQYVKMNALKK